MEENPTDCYSENCFPFRATGQNDKIKKSNKQLQLLRPNLPVMHLIIYTIYTVGQPFIRANLKPISHERHGQNTGSPPKLVWGDHHRKRAPQRTSLGLTLNTEKSYLNPEGSPSVSSTSARPELNSARKLNQFVCQKDSCWSSGLGKWLSF